MLNKLTLTVLGISAVAFGAHAFANVNSDNVKIGKPSPAVDYVTSNAVALSSGTFSGRSDHITTGQVTIEKTDAGYQLSFAADFSLDGAPDPVVALGNGETFDVANKIGALKKKDGRQTYQLPASFTPGQFSQVYVWCEKFSVPLGVAQLSDA